MLPAQDKRSLNQYPAPNQRPIQLIRPFSVLSASTYSAAITLPIGAAYLAAVLEQQGYNVSIVDALEAPFQIKRDGPYNLQGLSADELIERINPEAAIIGISLMFSQEWLPQRELIKRIHDRLPDAVIVVGGEHPTALPEYVLRDCPAIDFIVLGEGELTFLELCHAILSGRHPLAIEGIAYLIGRHFVHNKLSKRIANIDELPYPAWHLCKVENYHHGNWTMGISSGRNMPILATRGCPYQCTFCSNPGMWTTRYTMRDPKLVVDEIEWLVKTYHAKSIEFFDLTAIVKREWTIAFCNELKARNLDVSWQLPSGTRSEALDQETLQLAWDTKCRMLVYAPESGSSETLKLIKKRLKLDRLTQSIAQALRIGHTVKINLIIGFPHETIKHAWATLLFGLRMAWLGVDDCNIAVFTPYPGSDLFHKLNPRLNDQYFVDLLVQFDLTKAVSHTPHVSGRTLALLRILGHAGFYVVAYGCHPRRIVRLVKSLFAKRFEPNNVIEQRVYDLIARKRIAA